MTKPQKAWSWLLLIVLICTIVYLFISIFPQQSPPISYKLPIPTPQVPIPEPVIHEKTTGPIYVSVNSEQRPWNLPVEPRPSECLLTGRVISGQGESLPGATVTIHAEGPDNSALTPKWPEAIVTGVCDSEGRYTIHLLEFLEGAFVRVHKPGYEEIQDRRNFFALGEYAKNYTFFMPGTILRWHRELVARHWNYSVRRKHVGRPPVSKEIVDLVLRIARESPTWGYDRIQGSLANLRHRISDTTVANILKAHGIEPAPDRRRRSMWKSFLRAHWDVLASVDFTTIEVRTRTGLVTYYPLFFMELATRRVHFAGLTANPDEGWMLQVARNVTDAEEGLLRGKRYLLMDRDGKFSEAFRVTLQGGGVDPVRGELILNSI